MVFALSQDVLAAGIAAVFLMGLGTAVTVAALAVLAVTAKDLAGRLAASGHGSGAVVLWWAELAGAMLLLAFGTLFLLSSLLGVVRDPRHRRREISDELKMLMRSSA